MCFSFQRDPDCAREGDPAEGRPEPDRDQHWRRRSVLPLPLYRSGSGCFGGGGEVPERGSHLPAWVASFSSLQSWCLFFLRSDPLREAFPTAPSGGAPLFSVTSLCSFPSQPPSPMITIMGLPIRDSLSCHLPVSALGRQALSLLFHCVSTEYSAWRRIEPHNSWPRALGHVECRGKSPSL